VIALPPLGDLENRLWPSADEPFRLDLDGKAIRSGIDPRD
jgi:hypothetical protein